MTNKAFQCQMCGICCQGEGGIVTSKEDLKRLSYFFNLPIQEVKNMFTKTFNGKCVLLTRDNGYCIFFSTQNGCLVHTHKPDICQAWPFFRGNLEDELSWILAQDFCPGINKDIEHNQFVCQGLTYLKNKGLIQKDKPDVPKALITEYRYKELLQKYNMHKSL